MKVLYIGHYRESSGWGQAARDYILAMDSVGINVVPRAIKLGNPYAELPKRLMELESQSSENCNICIQHVLPHYMKYDSYFQKNIGLLILETSGIKLTSWSKHINLMDEIWTPCSFIANDIHNNKITRPIKIVPHTFDTSIYNREYSRLNLPTLNKFVFYFIGEMSKRKHLSTLIRAFHMEFKPYEPVELLIKVNRFGTDTNQLVEEVKSFCNQVKDNLRLYQDPARYKPEIIITANIDRESILRLHKSCDCFVCTSYGEAWSLGCIEAMGMGNIVISSATGGMLDYIDAERNGFLVDGKMEPVFGHFETFSEFGTAREKWFEISTSNLMETMRRVYELSPEEKERVRMEARMSVKKYDYKNIGQKMKELLYNV